MGQMLQIAAHERDRWSDVLERSAQYDFYHLGEYHSLAEQLGEGTPRLFVYEDGEHFIALPLLLRPLQGLEGLTPEHQGLYDASSVYGYAGPLISSTAPPQSFVQNFQQQLQHSLRSLGVVAAFSRLHPLLAQRELLQSMGETHALSQTVSIDLSLPVEVQRAGFRKNHKEGINRLRRSGVECIEDISHQYLRDFVAIYHETMTRVDAAQLYFFEEEYFRALLAMRPGLFHLFVALQNGEVIGGGVFSTCSGIVQYHLGGTRNDALRVAPMKLIFDVVRLWATEQKQSVFHLGGGVGSREDSLFAFKAGFSDRRHDFHIWRWIVMPELYADLCEERERWQMEHGLASAGAGFFPKYRSPAVRVEQSVE